MQLFVPCAPSVLLLVVLPTAVCLGVITLEGWDLRLCRLLRFNRSNCPDAEYGLKHQADRFDRCDSVIFSGPHTWRYALFAVCVTGSFRWPYLATYLTRTRSGVYV